MEQQDSLPKQLSVIDQPPKRIRKRTFSILCLLASTLLGLFGLYEMYAYGSADKVVGGDAYNFIILAARGTGWICVGIVMALIGVAFALFDLTDKQT